MATQIDLDRALWIGQITLGVIFLGAGLLKLAKSHDALKADAHMAWANDYSAGFIKFLGIAESLGAAGMTLPGRLGILPVLTPVAAVAFAVIMVGATVTHIRRSEFALALPTVVLGAGCVLVAYGRFVLIPLE